MKNPEGRRVRRAALGLGSWRLRTARTTGGRPSFRVALTALRLAVDAPDTDPSGGDLLRDTADRGPLGDVGGRGREQLELGPHQAHQGGQVLRVGRRVEGEGPAPDGDGDGGRLLHRAGGGSGGGRLRRIVGGRRRRGGHRCLLVAWVWFGASLCALCWFMCPFAESRPCGHDVRRERPNDCAEGTERKSETKNGPHRLEVS